MRDLDIAVVGLSCRLPGARSAREFWRNLLDGREAITRFTDDELRAAGVRAADLDHEHYVRANGILGDADRFDAAFFAVTPREAELMDPQQRAFLECAWEALESAGCDPARYGGRIGVYAGAGINTYLLKNVYPRQRHATSIDNIQMMLGNDKDFVATRVSFKLNLEGPSVNVQSACSTSLVAVHLACQSLLAGECDAALAGGVSIRAPEIEGYLYQDGFTFSPDGHCRAFDARARGFVPGNGVGVVVLKRLADAIAERDHVHAIIRGSAINNDGASKVAFSSPRLEGQAAAIRAAQAVADVNPRDVGYVEAHGTGTPVGDAIEVGALRTVFASAERGSCAIGSAKTNVGHTDAAAGVVGLIKAVMAVEHGVVPPSLNYEVPNPELDLESSPFFVNTEVHPWRPGPRIAGVSSFGLGGTNAHVVLEEPPARDHAPSARVAHVLPMSARSSTALERLAVAMDERLASPVDLADAGHTLFGRRAFAHRRAIVRRSEVTQVISGEGRERGVAFLLPGVGEQYPKMAEGLYRDEPVFRATIDRSSAIVRAKLGFDVREILYAGEGALRQTLHVQPALFVVEHALAELWASRGVRPSALLGYSLGEYVAACLAGVWTLEEALTIIAARARLLETLPAGAMLAVAFSESEARAYTGDGVWLAAINGAKRCVLSGEPAAIAGVADRLAQASIPHRAVQASHPFHSDLLRAIAPAYRGVLASTGARPMATRWVSNVTGGWITDEQARDPEYWIEQMCRPVRFADAAVTLSKDDPIFLEVGPGQSLGALAVRAARGVVAVASMRNADQTADDATFLAVAAAKLWVSGAQVDWYADDARYRVPLPTYPFERERYWLDPPSADEAARTGRDVDLADWFHLPSWKRSLAPARTPASGCWLFLGDDLGLATQWEARGGLAIAVGEAADDDGATLAAVRARAQPVDVVVLVIGADGDAALRGLHRVLTVVRAMPACARLVIVTTNAEDVDDAPHDREAALAPAAALAAARELGFACRHIDVDPRASGFAERLVDEIHGPGEIKVALRGARTRLVRTFDGVHLASGPTALRPRGVYVVMGGLGDVGLAVAKWLATEARARVVLIDRSEIPARETWGAWLGAHTEGDRTSRRLRALLELEDAGADVLPIAADVADPVSLRAAFDRVEKRFGAVHGVFHAAGAAGKAAAVADEAGREVALSRAAVHALRDVLAGKEADFVVLFASTASLLGSAGLVGYAAASAYMESFAALETKRGGARWISVAWDAWWSGDDDEHDVGDGFYAPKWLEIPFDGAREPAPRARGEVVVVHASDEWRGLSIARDLTALHEERGDVVRVVDAADIDARARLGRGDAFAEASRVYFLSDSGEGATPVIDAQDRGVRALHRMVRALLETPRERELVVVTRATQRVVGDETLRPHASSLGGFARAIARELADWRVGVVDVADDARTVAIIASEIPRGSAERAVRAGRAYERILEPVAAPAADAPAYKEKGVYVIAGGLGGIGFALAKHLAVKVRARLLLVGRSPETARAREKLAELHALGADAIYARADLADVAALRRARAQAEARFGRVDGVVHSALVLEDTVVARMDASVLDKVLAPKVDGTIALYEAFSDAQLDFMVFFSSAESFACSAGQSNYAAASAFEDAYGAWLRTVAPFPVVVVNWGFWGSVGVVASEAYRLELAKRGIESIEPAEGMHALERILGARARVAQVAFIKGNLRGAARELLPAGQHGMTAAQGVEALARILASSAAGAIVVATGDLAARFRAADALRDVSAQDPTSDDVALEGEVQEAVAEVWRDVLGLERVGPNESFFELGGDSLLGTKVVGRLQAAFQVELSMRQLWNNPTVARVALLIEELVIDQLLGQQETSDE